jgi:hypothetical protein
MTRAHRKNHNLDKILQVVIFTLLLPVIYFSLFSIPIISAEETTYKLLAPLPLSGGGSLDTTTTASMYIPGMVMLIIGIAGVLAIVKIIYGGVVYISTDAIEGKSDGKQHIQDALWGLLLIISSWVILYTINPKLININLEIEKFQISGSFDDTNIGRVPTRQEIEDEKSITGCVNCVAIAPGYIDPSLIGTTPPKPPGEYGSGAAGCAATHACYVNGELGQKLLRLTRKINEVNASSLPIIGRKISWRVNEMFPPTTKHSHPCHNPDTPFAGMCVDASIDASECVGNNNCPRGPLSRDAWKLATFFEAANAEGLYLVYELPLNMQGRATQLYNEIKKIKPNLVLNQNQIVSINIRLEHFSIYLNRAVHDRRQ